MTTDLVEKCAKAPWRRERERAAHCDDVLSSIRGQAIKPTMDPFDEHRDMWVGDALAVIDTLADGVTKLHPFDPAVDAALDKLLPWIGLDAHDANAKVVAVRDAVVAATQSFLSAAIRAAKTG